MSESDCIFCKIVAGEIPCAKVYEDDYALAFLDINPLAPGHLLIVPKRHVGVIMELSDGEAMALFAEVPRLADAAMAVSGASGLNVLQNNGGCAGQEVPHVHVHLIPREPGDGLGFRWTPTQYGEGDIERIRDMIVSQLSLTD